MTDTMTAEKPKPKAVLHPTAMRSNGADYVRTYHHIVVNPTITLEDLLRPAFWAHHTNGIRVGDLIDVLSEDGGMDVQLRVEEKGTGYIRMRPRMVWLREANPMAFDPSATIEKPPVPDGYKVSFAPRTRWRVMTENPVLEISRDHVSEVAAINAAIEHARKAAA